MLGEAAVLWTVALQDTAFAAAIRTGAWTYPALNVAHVLGVGLLLGAVLIADLRVLGIGRAVPLRAALGLCDPLIRAGLLILLPSGVLLFVADAAALWPNPVFRLKLIVIAVGMANGLAFVLASRRLPLGAEATARLRLQAMVSLLAWPVATAAGRLIAYV